jgi:3-hydroxyisobutyrate dehydrogenase-like beta-hydroxyacid dehydrogenase
MIECWVPGLCPAPEGEGIMASPLAPPSLTVAVLGLGEAGGDIARDLIAAGVTVRGFDPVRPSPPGAEAAASDADACRGANLVLSLTTAAEAEGALRQALPGVSASAVYADANTSAAGLKQRLAGLAGEAGLAFADVAIMAPVPGRGLGTPMLASGPAARAAARILAACGATVGVVDGPAGAAATRKLLRSVFYKGMAAAAIEALAAARSAGCEDWLREHLAAELAAADRSTFARLESGSHRHALRRSHEMAAAGELLDELAVPGRVTRASQLWLEDLAAAGGRGTATSAAGDDQVAGGPGRASPEAAR